MNGTNRWLPLLVIGGLFCMLIGAVDPLEGSLIILPGTGLIGLEGLLSKSRYRKLLYWSFVLVAFGVVAMWVLSSFGGIRFPGEKAGHSIWWGIFIVPYPVGWIMGVIGGILRLIELFKRPAQP